MREIGITVRDRDVEAALDRLLPLVPGGVRERRRRSRVELVARGDDLPSTIELKVALGAVRAELEERTADDDWRERRRADHVPLIVAGRVLVREDWEPGPAACGLGPEVIDIVLGAGTAFGTGTHPTTRTCLELLLQVPAQGGFADLGCGTGVLAILAARLGWSPVTAIDLAGDAAAATARNARANDAAVTVLQGDVTAARELPGAEGIAANVPAGVHASLAQRLGPRPPRVMIVSGFGDAESGPVLNAYRRAGLFVERRHDADGWTIVRLRSA
ncbi:MAG TPA: 50S ribosomal protein L11 methyltransferase [Solirubrobacteraceae bacterium]|nr:50S ribosomal protein L11 methyltransferase [Solirubrobacteraceae bacterium]